MRPACSYWHPGSEKHFLLVFPLQWSLLSFTALIFGKGGCVGFRVEGFGDGSSVGLGVGPRVGVPVEGFGVGSFVGFCVFVSVCVVSTSDAQISSTSQSG